MGQINLNNFKVITDKLNTFFVDNKFMVASEIPTTGDFKVGDIIINNGPTNVDEPMWICVEAGNPGTWTVFNSGGGSGGRLSTARNRVVLDGESKSEVSIGISGFNKASDALMVFINSRFMTEGVDYEINADSTKIVAIGEVWNEELASEFEIEMVVFKMMGEEGVVSSVNEIVKLKNTIIVNESVNEVEIGIDGFNEGDDLTVYRNSVYMIEGIDYEVQGNKIVSLKGTWNAEGGSDYKFTFEVLKAVAKVNPDAVVGMEHLTEDVKEAIEAAGNIDLSGKQDKTDNGLVTTDKTIVGAINELFQDVDSGKGIIADAIDDRNISKDSTFAAMGEAIEGIHADREEDRQKLMDILVGSNMELSGNESMDTLLDLIDMSNLDLSKVVQIACGDYFTFILYNDGRLYCSGLNDKGQLGLNDTTNRNTFTQVTTNINNDVKQVACGTEHTIILKNDGTVWSTGYNAYGQLGLNDNTNKKTFTQVTININNDVKQIACGSEYTFILKNDGSLWSCGNNRLLTYDYLYGNLGLGDYDDRNTFTQVTTNINNDAKQVVCGGWHTFILKNDGSVWACGRNDRGQLGLNDNTNKNTFNQVTTNINNDVKQVVCGGWHTFILKNDGSVWACGDNQYGQLGLGNTTNRNTFTQVTTNINNDVKQIAGGSWHTMIIKNDGSLWSCGLNGNGRLGLCDTTQRTTFTQVTTNINNDVKQVVCTGNLYTASTTGFSFILKNDGSLWSTGYNAHGQLGLGDTTDRNTFTVVNQTEALKTQVTSLQAEATANRGNLATVLTDEGVELTGNETLADLIVKTDEEFDRKNNELKENKGFNISSATTLPSTGEENDICVITNNPVNNFEITCNLNDIDSDSSKIKLYLGTKSSNDGLLGTLISDVKNNVIINYHFNKVYQGNTRLSSFYFKDNSWKPFTVSCVELIKDGIQNATSIAGELSLGGYWQQNSGYVQDTGSRYYYNTTGFQTKIDFTPFTKLVVRAKTNSSSRDLMIYATPTNYTVSSLTNSNSITYNYIANQRFNTTISSKEFDISSWTGEHYLTLSLSTGDYPFLLYDMVLY